MEERVYSLETEYAIAFLGEGAGKGIEPKAIVDSLRRPLIEKAGIANSSFLLNGSKFHLDVGHAEWSLPECRTAHEAALYDKAADLWLSELVPEAQRQLLGSQRSGRLLVVKNNVDAEGHTYGCHENYLTECDTPWLSRENQLRLTVRYLVPFLVTRQIYSGAGRAGCGPRLEQPFAFQIMQRADFIDQVVSKDTRSSRAIVNIGRETEPLASGNSRRLHLILADSNMSGWATWLKLATTGMLLRMLEELSFQEIPHLAEPVAALRQISRDPSCRAKVRLRDGRDLTAVDIQRLYLEQARASLGTRTPTAEEERTIRSWEEALDALETDPRLLFGKVDWITKKCLMDRYLARLGLEWNDSLRAKPVYFDLLRMDIQYHDLYQESSLYYRSLASGIDSLLSMEDIRPAMYSPPQYTRAKVRGDVLAMARRRGVSVEVDGWDEVKVEGWKVPLGDPLEFCAPEVFVAQMPTDRTPKPATDGTGASRPAGFEDQQLCEKVRTMIIGQLGVRPEQVTPETRFVEDLGADSLDTLVMEIEEEFGVTIPDEDAERLTTVGAAVSYIQQRLRARSLAPAPRGASAPLVELLEGRESGEPTKATAASTEGLPNEQVREQTRETAEFLLRAAANGDCNIRRRAVESLGHFRSPEHIPSLRGLLGPEQPNVIRLAAIDAMGRIGGKEAVEALIDLSAESDLAVRWRSMEVLDCLLDCRTLPSSRPLANFQGESLVRIVR